MTAGTELDANAVWHVWRRVLREQRLQEAMFAGTLRARAGEFGLADGDLAIAEEYARTAAGTRFFIANYRFRMVSSFVNALETAAPLTHRLLRAHTVDIEALAAAFLDSVRWLDFGPYVFTYGGRVLDYLVGRPEFTALTGLTELAAIERAGVRITVEAAEQPVDLTPATGAYRSIDLVTSVDTALDVAPWLREGASLGRTEPAAAPRTFLVYLRPPDLRRRIVAVPPAAVELVAELRTPRTAEEISATRDRGALLASLVRLGVVLAPAGSG
ncbi:hypothetical protein [Actinokineospora sp.]|uniref:hypothetical protein n=1 Tax=Actinokineospora sp. TaxID=1872133 RepID=UPI0040377544